MSDLMLDHVRNLVNKVSDDLREIGVQHSENLDKLLNAVDDVAANVLALEAIVAVLVKKTPIDKAEATAWLNERLASAGGGEAPTAVALIENLLP